MKKNYSFGFLFFIFGLHSACKSRSFNESDISIVGGKVVVEGSKIAASTVVLLKYEQPMCTGTLIEKNIVVTAAHCFHKGNSEGIPITTQDVAVDATHNKFFSQPFGEASVGFGADGRKPLFRKNIKLVFPHPQYTGGGYSGRYDIALLQFEGEAPPGFKPAKMLEPQQKLKANDPGIAVGYGYSDLDPDGSFKKIQPFKLREIPVKVLEILESTKQISTISVLNKTSTCAGDSGGPFFVKHGENLVLAGVHNSAPTSDCSYPQGYKADILVYRDWIHRWSSRFSEKTWKCRLKKPEKFPFGKAPCRSSKEIQGPLGLGQDNISEWLAFETEVEVESPGLKSINFFKKAGSGCYLEIGTVDCKE